MRFPLSYEGSLPSSGNPRRSGEPPKLKEIWNIRNAICAQIKSLYDTHAAFRSQSGARLALTQFLNTPLKINGAEFYPLARAALKLKCELKIDMWVNHPIASIITNGADLDNRLKTLFDALRVPANAQEIKDYMPAIDPYCCLLENDALISSLQIETMRNTAVPAGVGLDHVRLNIIVRLEPAEYDFINEPFQHD